MIKKMRHKSTLIVAAATLLLVVDAAIKTALFSVPFLPLSSVTIDAAATTAAPATPASCTDYESSERTIRVICDTTFEQLEKDIGDDSVIENLGNGEYLLGASIEVEDKVRLTIASPAVTWLKISNEGSPEQYNILVRGYMDIDGVKVTSWDPDEDSVVEQDSEGSVPRPYIVYDSAEGGIIQNSELAYIGYDGSIRRGLSIIDESANIEIKNSDFHNWWYAFYSNGAKNVTIDGNKFHDNHKYAIDPHTGTHDMNITNNQVYNNPGSGIICSLDCHNILIENNTVHDNGKNGISFSRNMHDSTVRNNVIYNSDRGILMNESPDNVVYGNIISNVSTGFYLLNQSPSLDGHTAKNKIYNNTIRNADIGITVRIADDNIFTNNTFENIISVEYSLEGGAEIEIESQRFTDDEISGGSGTNTVTIANSGTIIVDDDSDDNGNYDTDDDSYTLKLSGETATVKSIR